MQGGHRREAFEDQRDFHPGTDLLDLRRQLGIVGSPSEAFIEDLNRIGDVLMLFPRRRPPPVVEIDQFVVEADALRLDQDVGTVDVGVWPMA